MVFLLAAGLFLGSFGTISTFAAIKDATVFEDVDWSHIGDSPVISDTGWLQSMCSTEHYIICLENSSTKESTPDTFLAFYRNKVDENGNPVTQYSLAKQVTEMDYEHANGMTYNPDTNEILVVGATPLEEENRGLVYIVDADTLKFKRSVRLSSTYNLLGIAYSEETKHYIVQFFNVGYTESFFMELDTNFQRVGDLLPAKMWKNARHQDFCISGDYLISLGFTNKVSNSNVMQIYSIADRELLVSYDLDILENGEFIEPESICELGPGEILIGNAMKNPNRIAFYKTTVSAAFKLSTSVENGTITGSQKTVDYGSDYTVNYEPDENYEMESITIDGNTIDPEEFPNSYVFENVSQNHTIEVKYKEKPKFTLTTSVKNGFIDATIVKHRDNDWTIEYEPNEHYEITAVTVDGVKIPVESAEKSYTFKNIQEDHRISVEFQEIPSFEILTSARNGTISVPEEKLYRDDNYTVYYHPDEDYKLAWIEVDGNRTYFYEIKDNWNTYTFKQLSQPHEISVVYYWKYLPFAALMGAFVIITFFITLFGGNLAYGRSRRLKGISCSDYRKRRKAKKRAQKNREAAKARVMAKHSAMDQQMLEDAMNSKNQVDKNHHNDYN